uniref:C2H2-type domain-containing protein n=1 Tax=Periophthalmus magnuspinnatus TaxID=409849 RepID=A0A3B4ALS4_9GOBI
MTETLSPFLIQIKKYSHYCFQSKYEYKYLCVCSPPQLPESSAVCVKTEDSSLLQHKQTEHREETQGEDISTEPHLHSETEGHTDHSSDTDNDEDWRAPFSCSSAQMETEADGDHCLSPKYKSAPETSASVNYGDMSGTAQGADKKKHQYKPFSCSTCEKTFVTKCNLDKHVRTHMEKLFNCSTCKKTFMRKDLLEQHVNIHTGEKPYSCPTCNKKFTHKACLGAHLRIHTGVRLYSCSTCEKTFITKGMLEKHKGHVIHEYFRSVTA